MKILVTGANGLLGSNLVRVLLEKGHQVIAFIRTGEDTKTLDDLDIEKIEGNILNLTDLLSCTLNIDYVVHCAAITAMFPARSEIVNNVNIKGTKNLIEACILNGVKRLIYVGTANSFGSGTLDNLGHENNKYKGGKYGLDYMDSKFKAQNEVLKAAFENKLDTVVVNPTFMIGPYDTRPSSGEIILKLYRRKVPGYALGGKNWVAAKDVAVAISNALKDGIKGECYILGNENLPYKDAFDKIAKVIGVDPPKRKMSSKLVRTYGKMNSVLGTTFRYNPGLTHELAILSTEVHFYSTEKARKGLNMPQTPIDIAFKECFEWFDQNGYLTKK